MHPDASTEGSATLTPPVGDRQRAPRRRVEVLALLALGVVAVLVRFVARSALWLDEALSVEIAARPLGDLGDLLRHDGHPPLYYAVLHFWMRLFGQSDVAVRSLSGVCGVVLIGLMWWAGRRLGGPRVAWSAAVLTAVVPFMVRYSTEARMYALIMVLVVAAWLLADAALQRPSLATLAGLAACTSALVWTQYWALWLGACAAAGVGVRAWRAHRGGRSAERRGALGVLAALAVGGVTFVPWLGVLSYQAAHTGTPWGTRAMPATVVVETVAGLGGGVHGDQMVAGMVLAGLIVFGCAAVADGPWRVVLDVRTVPTIRRPLVLAVGTLALATVAMLLADTAFQSRYNAVWLPFALLVAAHGLAQLRHRGVWAGALVLVTLVCAPGVARNVVTPRTQAEQASAAIRDAAPGGAVVAVCPDQLGPSLARELGDDEYRIGTFPGFGDPHLVDWVDYADRVARSSTDDFVADVLARADGDPIVLVWEGTYRTHTGRCEAIAHGLEAARPGAQTILEANEETWESAYAILYPAGGAS